MHNQNQTSDDVINLAQVRSDFAPCPIQTAEHHWMDIRGNRLVPLRTDIKPTALQSTLSQSFILERISKGQMRFRVVGSAITSLVGHDVRGMPLSVLFDQNDRRHLVEVLTSVLEEPARVSLSLESGDAGACRGAEMILLPLRSDLGDITRVLGAMRLTGPSAQTAPRFRIGEIKHQTLTGYANEPLPGTVERKVDMKKPRSEPRRGHLRLVLSDED